MTVSSRWQLLSTEGTTGAAASGGPVGGPSPLGGTTRRALSVVGVVLLVVPVLLYFWYIHQYGVNAIWYDQWDNVALLTHSSYLRNSYAGHTDLSMLWAQHNENRMLFPNLVVLALGSLTRYNVLTELYLSAVLLVAAVALVILSHRRDRAVVNIIFYVPVALLMLSLGQSGDTLFGFQLAWYLILLALAVVIFLTNRDDVGWPVLAAAIVVAVVGSFSSLEGLLIWPAGAVVLVWRRHWRGCLRAWLPAAVVTTLVYFYDFDTSTTSGGGSYLLSHPLSVATFFFFNIGDVMGRPLPTTPGASDPDVVAIGVLVFLLAVACLVTYARPHHLGRSPVGPALICFGILFAATVAYGRSPGGLAVASQSRYATFNLLTLVGCYLCLLERWPARRETAGADDVTGTAAPVAPFGAFRAGRPWDDPRELVLAGLRFVAVVLIVVLLFGGVENGIVTGRNWKQQQDLAALVTVHAATAPDALLGSVLFPNPSVRYDQLRMLAGRAKADRLSFFATAEAAQLARRSLPATHYAPLSTAVKKPTAGSVLRGNVWILATTSGQFPIASLHLEARGPGARTYDLRPGTRITYGWLSAWSTAQVPNGSYTLVSIVRDSLGHTSESPPVRVTVDN